MVENIKKTFSTCAPFDVDAISSLPLRPLRPWLENPFSEHEVKSAVRKMVKSSQVTNHQQFILHCAKSNKFKFKILGSKCQRSGTYAKRAKQATKKDNRLCFLNYLAFLRPAADRAVFVLPWVVSPGRSYGFLWAVRLFKKM
jgi:hypothetical protein